MPSSVSNVFTYSGSQKGLVSQAVWHLASVKNSNGGKTHITREHLTNSHAAFVANDPGTNLNFK